MEKNDEKNPFYYYFPISAPFFTQTNRYISLLEKKQICVKAKNKVVGRILLLFLQLQLEEDFNHFDDDYDEKNLTQDTFNKILGEEASCIKYKKYDEEKFLVINTSSSSSSTSSSTSNTFSSSTNDLTSIKVFTVESFNFLPSQCMMAKIKHDQEIISSKMKTMNKQIKDYESRIDDYEQLLLEKVKPVVIGTCVGCNKKISSVKFPRTKNEISNFGAKCPYPSADFSFPCISAYLLPSNQIDTKGCCHYICKNCIKYSDVCKGCHVWSCGWHARYRSDCVRDYCWTCKRERCPHCDTGKCCGFNYG
jgi:hypothetical protein